MPPRRPLPDGTATTALVTQQRQFNLADLWRSQYSRFRKSRQRIAVTGQLRRGEIRPHVPADIEQADAFRVEIPHARLMVGNIIQYLTRKQPGVHRPSGPGPMATRLSDKIEQFLGAPAKGGALGELKSNGEALWESFCAHGANDGEYGLVVLPRPAHWSHILDYTEADPEDPTGERIRPYFQRDQQGRDPEDEFYAAGAHTFQIDESQSSKAFADYVNHERACALPIVVEVLHPKVCLPIGVDPATGKVDAMLIRTVRSVRSLKALGFDWDMIGPGDSPGDDNANVSPTSVLLGGGLEVTLYQLLVPGGIFYQVGEAPRDNKANSDAYPTYIRRAKRKPGPNAGDPDEVVLERTAAFVNLAETYGICEVPGGYFYGAHDPDEMDPDLKAFPLLHIFASLIRGVNQTVSSIVHHAYEVGFGGWFADPSNVDPKFWTEDGKPMKVKVQRGSVSYIAGKVTPAVHTGVDKDVSWFVTMALNLLERFGPSQSMTGGDAADGGFSQAVAQASGENALGQILGGAMAAMQRTCECVLEEVAAISDMIGEPVPVYTRYDPKTKTRHDLLTLSSKDLNGDYRIEIAFPMRKGSNLPLAQGMAQWHQMGLLSHYTWLEDGWGDEQPDQEIDRINVETALKSQQGQALVWQLAGRIQGDREMAKIAELQQAGKLGPGGTPTALMPPRPAPANGIPPGHAGVEVGNPAQSSLAGVMSGQMMTRPQNNVAAATGAAADVTGAPAGPMQ